MFINLAVIGRVSDLMLIDFSCRDPAAVVGAMLADLPNNKEVEEKIIDMFGQDYVKVWKEVKLFLDPRKCEVTDNHSKELHDHSTMQTDGHQSDSVCTDGNCILAWLEGKTFSYSAKLSLLSWVVLLTRLVTGVHWPQGWSVREVRMYLMLLEKLLAMLLEGEEKKLGKKSLLKIMAEDFHVTVKNYKY